VAQLVAGSCPPQFIERVDLNIVIYKVVDPVDASGQGMQATFARFQRSCVVSHRIAFPGGIRELADNRLLENVLLRRRRMREVRARWLLASRGTMRSCSGAKCTPNI
jgi:hypothetical protein